MKWNKEKIMLRKQSMRQHSTMKPEQRQEQKLIILTTKINTLMRVVECQTKMIHEMRNDMREKHGLSKVALDSNAEMSHSSSQFSAESSFQSQNYLGKFHSSRNLGAGMNDNRRRSSAFSNVCLGENKNLYRNNRISRKNSNANKSKKNVRISMPKSVKRGSRFSENMLTPIIQLKQEDLDDVGSNKNVSIGNLNDSPKQNSKDESFKIKVTSLKPNEESERSIVKVSTPIFPPAISEISNSGSENTDDGVIKLQKILPEKEEINELPQLETKRNESKISEIKLKGEESKRKSIASTDPDKISYVSLINNKF